MDESTVIKLYLRQIKDTWLGVASDETAVYATSFSPNKKQVVRDLLHSMPFETSFQKSERPSELAKHTLSTVQKILSGQDHLVKIPLAIKHLPAYTQRILRYVSLIPAGYVSSYGRIVLAAGGGARAVGNIMAMNHFAPIVPCHRVVTSDLTLGGYSAGLDTKLALLTREKKGFVKKKEILVNGAKLEIFPVEKVLEKAQKRKR